MLISKSSTASLGKFDKKIDGEPKAKGIKRKFEPNVGGEEGWSSEKGRSMDLLKSMEGKKRREGKDGGEVNVRKAVRYHDRVERAKGRSDGKSTRGKGKGRK